MPRQAEVPAVPVDDRADRTATPGGFKFVIRPGDSEPCGMEFTCPCGCGREGYLPFKPEPSPSWDWDGDRAAPTLRPSVQQVGGCRWHDWLTAGVWRSC